MGARHALQMISLQATSGPTSSSPLKAEEMIARIKGLSTDRTISHRQEDGVSGGGGDSWWAGDVAWRL
jgi:hypothetical protein